MTSGKKDRARVEMKARVSPELKQQAAVKADELHVTDSRFFESAVEHYLDYLRKGKEPVSLARRLTAAEEHFLRALRQKIEEIRRRGYHPEEWEFMLAQLCGCSRDELLAAVGKTKENH